MYFPARFKPDDQAQVLDLIRRHPLATIISTDAGKPFISHLPLVPELNGQTIRLVGHMAKANPHWRLLERDPEVVAIFHGPNTYISPDWYVENDVPTWNYAVAHCGGTTRLIADFDGIIECLKTLHEFARGNFADRWEFWLPDDLNAPDHLTGAIIGFQITVTDIKAKFKLSQNRSGPDLDGILAGLATRSDDSSKEMTDLMSRGRRHGK